MKQKMQYRVEQIKFQNGVRRTILLEDGIPSYYPTLFTSIRLRALSPNRQRTYLYDIQSLFDWCNLEGINLELRFKENQNFSENEIVRLVDFCAWNAETKNKLLNGIKLLPKAYKQINRKTHSARVGNIREYVEFLFNRLSPAKNKGEISERVSKTFKSYKPKLKSYTKNNTLKLSDQQLSVLFEKIMPEHPENPWRDKSTRIRNLIILNLFYETGIRKSELAGLYVSDIKGDEVSIYRRHNNPIETRKYAPNVKTGERTLPIPDALAELINMYITDHRVKLKTSRKHPYLFVSHKKNQGEALSLSAINEIFKKIRNAFPELKNLSSHDFRHHMNYRISKMIDDMNVGRTPEEKAAADEQVRSQWMGWKPDGQMQQTYNKRYNVEEASKRMVKRASKLNRSDKSDSE